MITAGGRVLWRSGRAELEWVPMPIEFVLDEARSGTSSAVLLGGQAGACLKEDVVERDSCFEDLLDVD